MPESDKFTIEFNKLWNDKALQEFLQNDLPTETICQTLKAFYAFKLWRYVDSQDYDSIRKLEGLMELHNLIQQGNTE